MSGMCKEEEWSHLGLLGMKRMPIPRMEMWSAVRSWWGMYQNEYLLGDLHATRMPHVIKNWFVALRKCQIRCREMVWVRESQIWCWRQCDRCWRWRGRCWGPNVSTPAHIWCGDDSGRANPSITLIWSEQGGDVASARDDMAGAGDDVARTKCKHASLCLEVEMTVGRRNHPSLLFGESKGRWCGWYQGPNTSRPARVCLGVESQGWVLMWETKEIPGMIPQTCLPLT
jgi:hypothetical protein